MNLNDDVTALRRRLAICAIIFTAVIIIWLFFALDTYAAPSNKAIRDSLSEWRDHLSLHTPLAGIIKDAFRFLGWKLILGLGYIGNQLGGAVTSIYSLLANNGESGLFTNIKFVGLYNNIKPYIAMLFAVAIAFFGYFLIFKRADTQISTWQNILIILLVLTAMPSIASTFGDWTAKMSEGVRGTYISNLKEPATGIILSNIIDLYHVDQTGEVSKDMAFPSYKEDAIQDITTAPADTSSSYIGSFLNSWNKLSVIDINQLTDAREDIKNTEFFSKKLQLDADGKYTVIDLDQSLLPINNSYYYTYSVRWWTCIFSLIGLILCLLFTCFKSGRLLFEVAAEVLIMPAVAVTDLASGQRIKEMFRHFIGIFAVFFLIAMLLGLYFVGLQFLTYVYAADVINGFTYVLLQFILAFTVIDGPNIVERILGIDSGIKSGYQMLVGGAMLMSGLSRGARGASMAAKSAGNAGLRAVKATIGNPVARNAQGRRVLGGMAGKMADLKAGRTDMQIKRKAKQAGVSYRDIAYDGDLKKKGPYTTKQERLDNESEMIARRGNVYKEGQYYSTKLKYGNDPPNDGMKGKPRGGAIPPREDQELTGHGRSENPAQGKSPRTGAIPPRRDNFNSSIPADHKAGKSPRTSAIPPRRDSFNNSIPVEDHRSGKSPRGGAILLGGDQAPAGHGRMDAISPQRGAVSRAPVNTENRSGKPPHLDEISPRKGPNKSETSKKTTDKQLRPNTSRQSTVTRPKGPGQNDWPPSRNENDQKEQRKPKGKTSDTRRDKP
jgi:hypothetical protein